MTKQEKIREGIIQITKSRPMAYQLLKYLQSQGAVLQVERELPKCDVEYNPNACGAEDDTDNCYRGGWDDNQNAMLDAGCGFFESLIEEVKE